MKTVAQRVCRGAIVAFFACVVTAAGQPGRQASNAPAFRAWNAVSNDASAAIEVTADHLDYDRARHVLKATGNVVVVSGSDELHADAVTADTETQDFWAAGSVVFSRQGDVWKGEKIYCNFDSGRAYTEAASEFRSDPYRVRIEQGERSPGGEISGHGSVFTTCERDYPHCHYYLRARKIRIVPGEVVKAWHVVVYLGGVPIMYVPYWQETSDGYGFDLTPGYSSRVGGYLLTSYGYGLATGVKGRTRVDFRTRRGWAVGQDIDVDMPDGWKADLRTYFADDKRPVDSDEDSPEGLITSERYRIRFSCGRALGPRTYILSRFHYLSDPDVLEDFFRSEYRLEPKPENYFSLQHRGDRYVAGLVVRGRLNSFHDSVDRLPEASLYFPRQRMGDMALCYDSRTTIGRLEKEWAAGSESDPYALVRADTEHTLSTSRRFGVLNVVPHVGGRLTYYSETDSGADVRAVFKTGLRTFFKAFRVWSDSVDDQGGLRHVAEPYLRYVFVPEPNLAPTNLFHFDSVDEVTARNDLRAGVRNKLQTKRNGRPRDLVDVDLWLDTDLESGQQAGSFDSIGINAELLPFSGVTVDLGGKMALDKDGGREFSAQVVAGSRTSSHADIEYRYVKDKNNLIIADTTYDPGGSWTFMYDARYEIDEGRLQEHTFWARRNYDCMYAAVGFNHIPGYERTDGSSRDEEYRILFRLWVKAFPDMGITVD